MTTRWSLSVPDEVADAVDAICEEYSLARSRVVVDIVGRQLEGDDLEAAVLDAIPESTLKLAEKERMEQAMKDRQKLREKRHSFEDRTRGYFRKRLEGDAAYEPEGMRELAEGYREDAQIWHDDEDEAARKEAMVDEWMSWYEAGYWAREHAEQVETELLEGDVSGWFEVGEDVHRLREHVDDVVEQVRKVANAEGVGFDSDAVIDSVARRWSVCRGAAHLLIESLTESEVTMSEALMHGGDRLRSDDDLALGGAPDEPRPSELPEDATVRMGGRAVDLDEDEAEMIGIHATDGGEP